MRLVIALLLAVSLTSCGDGDDSSAGPTPTPAPSSATPTTAPTISDETESELVPLSKGKLEEALLDLNDLPPGFTEDPADDEPDTNKTYCDYKEPFEAKLKVTSSFTNEADQQVVASILRQYAGAREAKASFEALVDTMKTCRSDEFEGDKLTYAVMSAPKLGDGSIGIAMSSGPYTIKQNFVLIGPTLVTTGGIGLTAQQVADLLALQVNRYENAASS